MIDGMWHSNTNSVIFQIIVNGHHLAMVHSKEEIFEVWKQF